jgi:hypothetical protein
MRSFTFIIFVILTFCCWGLYGPVLHVGQETMGGGTGQKSLLRPLICVGVAYFLIAVVFPTVVLITKGEKGFWSIGGFFWSFIAGAVGAVGALGIILAFKFQGKPFYVMPLVFGLAPIVNTFVTMAMAKTFKRASTMFYIAIVIVAIGAAGVLINKPSKAKIAKSAVAVAAKDPTTAEANTVGATDDAGTTSAQRSSNLDSKTEITKISQTVASEDTAVAVTADTTSEKNNQPWPLAIGISIALTALCWGAYGPVLHKGQLKMGGSRLRPFFCVGLAYFAIAVVVPLLLMDSIADPGSFDNVQGIFWSLGAGATGAIGALGIIYAFNFGGKPVFVMPLVFGFAPVVNTFYEIATKNLFGQVSTYFFVSLAMVIVGAVLVLVLAPRNPPAAPAPVNDV